MLSGSQIVILHSSFRKLWQNSLGKGILRDTCDERGGEIIGVVRHYSMRLRNISVIPSRFWVAMLEFMSLRDSATKRRSIFRCLFRELLQSALACIQSHLTLSGQYDDVSFCLDMEHFEKNKSKRAYISYARFSWTARCNLREQESCAAVPERLTRLPQRSVRMPT